MRTFILLFVLTLAQAVGSHKTAIGRQSTDTLNVNDKQHRSNELFAFRILALHPSLELEIGLNPDFNIAYSANFMAFFLLAEDEAFMTHTLAFRYYYNLDKRFFENRNVRKFSGNYFSIKAMYLPGAPSENIILTGFSWGLRRNFFEFINVGIEAGFHFYPGVYHFSVYPIIGFVL